MENTEKIIDKTTELLTKELETMNANELHDFFMFFYKTNRRTITTNLKFVITIPDVQKL